MSESGFLVAIHFVSLGFPDGPFGQFRHHLPFFVHHGSQTGEFRREAARVLLLYAVTVVSLQVRASTARPIENKSETLGKASEQPR